jgi:hypothetical protein
LCYIKAGRPIGRPVNNPVDETPEQTRKREKSTEKKRGQRGRKKCAKFNYQSLLFLSVHLATNRGEKID